MRREIIKVKHVIYGMSVGVRFRIRYFTPHAHLERTVFSGTKEDMPNRWENCVVTACDDALIGSYYDKIITIEKPFKGEYRVKHRRTPKQWLTFHKTKGNWY